MGGDGWLRTTTRPQGRSFKVTKRPVASRPAPQYDQGTQQREAQHVRGAPASPALTMATDTDIRLAGFHVRLESHERGIEILDQLVRSGGIAFGL